MLLLFLSFCTVILSLKERITVKQTKEPIVQKFLIILIFIFGYGQISPDRILNKPLVPEQRAELYNGRDWEYEVVDSAACPKFNSLTIDTNNIPHIVYDKIYMKSVAYAHRSSGVWQKEMVDSAYLCFGFSIICDSNNNPHISYYVCKDSSFSKTYICHGCRQDNWIIDTLDSINGWLGNYFENINSSINIDTLGLPGIAYIVWNVEDSLHYIKYAHYDGIDWDTSVVEYDSAYANIQKAPTDYSPSLEFSSKNIPYIAFYHVYALYNSDTLKIAYYDDTLSKWIVDPVLCDIQAGIPVSLSLNSQGYPFIAHSAGGGLWCSWWDGFSWQHEYTGNDLGWTGIRIDLDLDSLDNPHIAYLPDPMVAHPCYSYKQNGMWYNCGWIEPDSSTLTTHADISFALDSNDQSHVCYPAQTSNAYFKYAKGTFVGIEEVSSKMPESRYELEVYPNPSRGIVNIAYTLLKYSDIELSIYDVTGSRMNVLKQEKIPPGYYQERIDTKNLSSGIYFVVLRQDNVKVSKKFLLVK
ncbi:MAG TPA: T9SS type A sorting domain-containing protein [candidate division WOR-3 bacterium]|uniref:T9SS type A sorting domain-containing protein n=1 Tax=candidate division WOR-3 bacterium TaxID=2052148 RepID=A0A9C9EMA4_UNCW3|nr:T9SS type A sorting domain-containing protein [candidate division WOR-3 bacterium]